MLKMCQILVLLLSISLVTASFPFLDDYGLNRNAEQAPLPEAADNDALFLTPYIEKGEIKKAQELATVKPLLKNVESFSGFLTVNKQTSSNLFFWLFKSQTGDWEKRPLVIWLQGGPGTSSMFGLLVELGPFQVTKKGKLRPRKYSWSRKYNVVFFDNPVGAGYSFTKHDSGYAQDENDVARDLYEAIAQLYKLFPSLQKNKVYIAGESYAGKYIPAIAYRIYKTNQSSAFKIKLGGLMIANGFTDPINMLGHADYLYKIGLIDENRRDRLSFAEEEARANIKSGDFSAAQNILTKEWIAIHVLTGLKSYYNYVNDFIGYFDPETKFINDPATKKAIHVGSYPFNNGVQTYTHLQNDLLQSVKPWVEELLSAEEFPILFYNGQLDIVVAYPLSLGFYNSLNWPRAEQYHNANRCQFKVGDDVAGYYKTAGTFTEVLVRNTGHTVSFWQPKWAYELMDRFISNSSAFICE